MFPAPRHRPVWIIGFLVLTLAAVYGAFFYLYFAVRREFDEELGARLTAAATATAAAVNGARWERLVAGDRRALEETRRELEEVRGANALSDIFLFDAREATVLDLRGQYPEGEPNPALGLDLVAATTALGGIPAFTRLYESGGTYLKSAYAPVTSPEGEVLGGVGVEGSAAFFVVLDRLRTTLLGAAGLVLGAMAVLGVGFVRIQAVQARLERRLRRAETLGAMGQMTAMLAHEIRNPLGIIRGSAETLADRYDLHADEIYRFIPEEVDRLHRTLSTYLDFARTESAGALEDAGDALRRTLDLVERDLQRRDIVLETSVEEGSWPVRAGAHLLQQAFLNAILNARDAMPGGGVLKVSLEHRGGRLRVVFADNGTGMEEAVRRRAFEPFYTSKEKGSGLGLAVVRRVVEETGGRVELESAPGKGTTVSMIFGLAGGAGESG